MAVYLDRLGGDRMNVFNLIAGAGGVSEGLYIWKKSEYVPSVTVTNPSIEVAVKDNSNITITSEEFNFSYFGEKSDSSGIADTTASELCTFLNGFTKDDYCRFQISSHRLMFAYGGLGNSYNSEVTKFVPNGKSATLTLLYSVKNEVFARGTYTYTGTKTIPAKIGDMVGYVISDKEDAYPDGAEYKGFYYEKYNPLNSESFGFNNIEVGEFTPTGNMGAYNIRTSAERPYIVFVAGVESDADNKTINRSVTFGATNNNLVSGAVYQSLAYRETNTGSSSTQILANATSSNYFKAGVTYRYILFT